MTYLLSPMPKRAYQLTKFDREKKPMLAYDFRNPRTAIEKRELFSLVRAVIHRAIERQISERIRSGAKDKCKETWGQYMRGNRKQYGRLL